MNFHPSNLYSRLKFRLNVLAVAAPTSSFFALAEPYLTLHLKYIKRLVLEFMTYKKAFTYY